MKKLLIAMCALTAMALAAFEVGKSDAVIYHTKANVTAAKKLAAHISANTKPVKHGGNDAEMRYIKHRVF